MTFNFPRILLVLSTLAALVLAGLWVYVVFFAK